MFYVYYTVIEEPVNIDDQNTHKMFHLPKIICGPYFYLFYHLRVRITLSCETVPLVDGIRFVFPRADSRDQQKIEKSVQAKCSCYFLYSE